jgi:hypothetical protein
MMLLLFPRFDDRKGILREKPLKLSLFRRMMPLLFPDSMIERGS